MKKLLVLLLAGILVFTFVGCSKENIEAGPDSTDRVEENSGESADANSIVMHYGTDYYGENEATFYLPEGAYFDESDYADYQEDGYMYSFWVYDDEREYSAYAADYWSREVHNNDPIGYGVAQQLYFDGELDEETAAEYTNCSQNVTNLGFQWEGKDVVLIETNYTSASDFDYAEKFVGVEYEVLYWNVNENGDTEENLTARGLVGFGLESSGWEELTQDQCAWIAGGLFGVDSGRTWPLED